MSRPRYPAEDHGQYLFDLADETREPLYTIEEAAALLDLDPRKIGPRGANRRRSELYRSRTLPLAPSRKRARGDRLFIRGVLAMSGGVFTEAALPSLLPRGRLQPRRPWNPAARWPRRTAASLGLRPLGYSRGYSFACREQVKAALTINCTGYRRVVP